MTPDYTPVTIATKGGYRVTVRWSKGAKRLVVSTPYGETDHQKALRDVEFGDAKTVSGGPPQ